MVSCLLCCVYCSGGSGFLAVVCMVPMSGLCGICAGRGDLYIACLLVVSGDLFHSVVATRRQPI